LTDWEAYVEALREEKLKALGVLLGDEPPLPPVMNSRGQTPMVPLVGSLSLISGLLRGITDLLHAPGCINAWILPVQYFFPSATAW